MSPRKIVVSIHSVHDGIPLPGSYGVKASSLEAAIKSAMALGYRTGALANIDTPVPSSTIYFSHDDGTSDFVNHGLPIFRRLMIDVHCSLITGVWEGVYPVAHLVQLMLGLMTEREISHIDLPDVDQSILDDGLKKYDYEPYPRARFKAYMNLILTDTQARDILAPYFKKYERLLRHRFAKLSDFHGPWVTVGGHGVKHLAYDGTPAYVQEEVLPCVDVLRGQDNYLPIYTPAMSPRHGVTTDMLVEQLNPHGITHVIDGMGDTYTGGIIRRMDVKRFIAMMVGNG